MTGRLTLQGRGGRLVLTSGSSSAVDLDDEGTAQSQQDHCSALGRLT